MPVDNFLCFSHHFYLDRFRIIVIISNMYIKNKVYKNKDGSTRTYMQLVESRRVNGQPRPIPLMNLGRVDKVSGRERIEKIATAILKASQNYHILNLDKDVKAEDSKEYGPLLIFKRLWEELGLKQVIEGEMAVQNTEFDISDAVFNMVLNRLTAPSSKRQLPLWQEECFEINKYELHQYYRAMDYLIEHKDRIEKNIFDRMRTLFAQDIDIVLFDTTSLVYYGEGDETEELLDYGFSKARRGDLKQVVVGVLMSKQGIPLGHEVFSGNTNDVTCFRKIIDKVSRRFKIGKIILVGDRGLISKKNISYLEENGYEYILGFRMRTIKKEERSRILEKADLEKIKETLHWKEVKYNGQRLLVCYNPERAPLDAKKREEVLERIKDKIKDGSILSVVENKDYKRYLRIEGEAPIIDEEKVKKDALYDGVFVLTSNTDFNGGEIIDAYKNLWQVEAAFRQLKSELEIGPIYHWKDRRVRAHIMICFLGLILRTALNKKLKKKHENYSYAVVISDLKKLQVVSLKIKDEPVIVRTELKPGALMAFQALSMRPPDRTLFSQCKKEMILKLSGEL